VGGNGESTVLGECSNRLTKRHKTLPPHTAVDHPSINYIAFVVQTTNENSSCSV